MLGAAQILWLPEEISVPGLLTLTSALVLLTAIHLKFKSVKPLIWLSAGLLYALLFCHIQLQQQLPSPTTKDIHVRIDGLPKFTSNKVSFIGTDTVTGHRYLLNHYLTSSRPIINYQTNAIYNITANLKPPHGMANGVGFDREKWLFRHGIDGIGSITAVQIDKQKPNHGLSIDPWRSWFSNEINQHFTDPPVNALIHALSIGDKSHFDQQSRLMFQNTGTAHLIAISGLHIGMVAMFGWLVGGLVFFMWPRQNHTRPVIQVIFGLLFATFYAGLAGFTVATQRALIMLGVYGFFKMSRRTSYAWDVWSMSLLLVMLIDPLNVLDGGFWLSFTAVAVLILAFNGSPMKQAKSQTFLQMQLSLLVGMLPLSLAFFSRINLLSPMVNLIMIPLMSFVLIPLLMLLLLTGSLWQEFPAVLVKLLNICSSHLLSLLSWFNQFDQVTLQLAINHWWQYLVLIMGALLLTLPKAIPQRYWGVLLVLLGLLSPTDKPPEGHFKASFLDVGQGLSVVIETQNHTMVYDVGATYDSGFNMADAVVLPFLQNHHIKQIDALILSHQDNDHSGAAQRFQKAMPVVKTWGTENQHQPCYAGEKWTWDGVEFSFLSPLNLTPYLHNNSSCVLKIRASNLGLLLTGDIEAPVEYRLSQMQHDELTADVLLMPHHGSKTSSTEDFIVAVSPKQVINSSGQFNPFNHPAATVVERYHQLGLPITDTQTSGLITLQTFPALKINSLRKDQPRIWRKKKPE